MTSLWIRRATLALACAGAALLAACGDGSVVSDLSPKRFLSVGDGFTDVGQQGGTVYTINDGTQTWTQQLAGYYGVALTPASAGGWGYSQGYARVDSVDTSGHNAPSVKQQVDTLLARTAMQSDDVMMINGGIADIVAAVNATGISTASTDAVKAAGKALADQTRRLVQAGAKHVVVTGVYHLGNTPWARAMDQQGAINNLSIAFNDALLVNIEDLGANVLYFDSALFFNLIFNKPGDYATTNVDNPVCTTPDVTTCTPSTLVAGANPDQWMFADSVYMAPVTLRKFSNENYLENIYSKFKKRW